MSNQWPYTTPSGHVYHAPTTYPELLSRFTDRYQGEVESWAEDETIPDPTWEILGVACDEVERLRGIHGRVRDLHFQYRPFGVEFDCCAHCNMVSSGYVAWPCQTIAALGEVS